MNADTLWSLFWRFLIISLVAFGRGSGALPLIERVSVAQMGWVSEPTFGAAVGFGYLAPGPVLITATFIGYQVAGLLGAVAATLGIFLAPTLLAAGAASGVERLSERRWLRDFGDGAVPAVVGLFAATGWTLARASMTTPLMAAVTMTAFVLAVRTKALQAGCWQRASSSVQRRKAYIRRHSSDADLNDCAGAETHQVYWTP